MQQPSEHKFLRQATRCLRGPKFPGQTNPFQILELAKPYSQKFLSLILRNISQKLADSLIHNRLII